MAQIVDKIKRDFARHQKKAGILAVLAVILLAFIAKAFFDMSGSRPAAAETATGSPNTDVHAALAMDSEEHMAQSRELWKLLKKQNKDAMTPDVAFSFEHSYYNENPNRKIALAPEHVAPVDNTPKIPVTNAEAEAAKRKALITAQTRDLVVRSTVVGSGISKPVAVINDLSVTSGDRILAVGDYIKGFEITAIRAREVEFKKDGITLAVEMARTPGK